MAKYKVQKLPIPKIKLRTKYPFSETPEGMSFIVPSTDAPALHSMRSLCVKWNRKLKSHFRVAMLANGDMQVINKGKE